MIIVADENIPLVKEFFAEFGDLILLPGREMNTRAIQNADVLLVRSVTPINRSTLSSRVKFVGSATIGVDHVDVDLLREKSIYFSSAPGCNANAVAEYVVVALLQLASKNEIIFNDQQAVVVGYGNVGKAVFNKLSSLGLACRAVDPLLEMKGEKDEAGHAFITLEEALSYDIISLHTPLTTAVEHATYHLLQAEQLAQLNPNAILINAGRGAVINNTDLLTVLKGRPDLQTVLDVWESEPQINTDLLTKVTLATPHIAGYSLDGKWRGTEMLYEAFCRWQGIPVDKSVAQFVGGDSVCEPIAPQTLSQHEILTLMESFYSVSQDDQRMRSAIQSHLPVEQVAKAFDQLRKHYPGRREFHSRQVDASNLRAEDKLKLSNLGFSLAGIPPITG